MARCTCQPCKRPLNDYIRAAKNFFRILGATVALLFVLQGCLIFCGPDVGHDELPLHNFWKFCHWISEGALVILVGLTVFFLELRSCSTRVATRMAGFAANRIGVALLYFWLGAYLWGGRIQEGGTGWGLLAYITGIAAWVVCFGHLCLSCCARRVPADKPETSKVAPSTDDPVPPTTDCVTDWCHAPQASPKPPDAAHPHHGRTKPMVESDMETQSIEAVSLTPKHTDAAWGAAPAWAGVEEVQWATVGDRPFGSL